MRMSQRKTSYGSFFEVSLTNPRLSMLAGIVVSSKSNVDWRKCDRDGREWRRATLRGGAEAGDFSLLRRTTSMKTCKQLCCASDSCELALLVNGGCFSVQCRSADACIPENVKRSGVVAPRIFVRNIGKSSCCCYSGLIVIV